ncbi:hypothetical protein C1646_775861 [Rhizophagus diaphanus]|nr:hypothetical protein C1646_775861 [Rhizophagus diaphanus] [Rhizophagus sp. MUCL 43196]
MYVDKNTPLDKPLTNDLLTLCDINYNKINVMRPMTDSEIYVIIFGGIINGTDTETEVINGQAETIIRINIDNNEEYWEELNKFNPDK